MITRPKTPTRATSPPSSFLPTPDALVEVAEGETDIDGASDGSFPVVVAAEPDDAFEDGVSSAVDVNTVLDAAVGLSEVLVIVLVVGDVVDREDDVALSWVPLPCEQPAVHVVVVFADAKVVQGLRLQDALQQASVA